MALIVITVADTEDGAQVSVQCEPALPKDVGAECSPAQITALNMLRALQQSIKQDHGLIQLIN